jgi:hypothetical protein
MASSLSDVPVEGYHFTWFKNLGTPRAVEERFDHALANSLWFNFFPEASIETLVAPASDHYPCYSGALDLRCSKRCSNTELSKQMLYMMFRTLS